MTIVLPCPGESACAAPQKSAARERGEDDPDAELARGRSAARSPSRRRGPAPASVVPLRERRRRVGSVPGSSVADDRRDVERALEQVLRVRAQLVARARRVPRRRRSPSSRSGRRSSCRGRRSRSSRSSAGPRSTTWSRVVRRPAAPGGCASAVAPATSSARLAVDGQLGAARDAARVGRGVDPAGLEGRDLRHVEDVEDVEPVARRPRSG